VFENSAISGRDKRTRSGARANAHPPAARQAMDHPRRVCMRPAPSTGRDDKHHAGHRSVRTRFHIWKRSPCSAFPAKAGTQSHKAGAHQRTIFDNSPNTGPPPSRGTRRMELQRDVGCILMHRDQTPVHQDAPYTAPAAPTMFEIVARLPTARLPTARRAAPYPATGQTNGFPASAPISFTIRHPSANFFNS